MTEHEKKYNEIIQKIGIENLIKLMPIDQETMKLKFQKDENLNNVPLYLWDKQDFHVRPLIVKAGLQSWSLSQTVCLLKHVAQFYFINR